MHNPCIYIPFTGHEKTIEEWYVGEIYLCNLSFSVS